MAIKAQYARMSNIADQLGSASKSMADILTNITTEYNKIGSPDVWAGTSADTAKETFTKLSSHFVEFSDAINECNKYIAEVVADYEAAEQAISSQYQ